MPYYTVVQYVTSDSFLSNVLLFYKPAKACTRHIKWLKRVIAQKFAAFSEIMHVGYIFIITIFRFICDVLEPF